MLKNKKDWGGEGIKVDLRVNIDVGNERNQRGE